MHSLNLPTAAWRSMLVATIAVADGREPELKPRRISTGPGTAEPTAVPVIADPGSGVVAQADVIESVSGT